MAKSKSSGTIKRTFTIDPYAIMSLIKAQAGSIGKAMLEAVANSMDAGATRIDVTLDDKNIVLADNGRGLTQEKEIYEFFERFGFDHSNLDRKVGRFGVGRGQLFCFGVNTWRTNTFQMDIDIKRQGLDYDLDLNQPKVPGMAITIALYEPLKASEQLAIEEEFCQLVKFCTVPVFLNGKQVSTDPANSKWDHETEEAWFKVRKDGRLSIYSQGLYIKDTWGFGVGGVVVSKPGNAIAQNLARNDILVKECAIWKRLEATVSKLALPFKEKTEKEHMTDSMRQTLSRESLAPEKAKELMTQPVFTLSNRKHISLTRLIASGFIGLAKTNDPAADRLMQRKQALILAPETLDRFHADSVAELVEKLVKAVQAQLQYNAPLDYRTPGHVSQWNLKEVLSKLKGLTVAENTQDLPFEATLPFTEVKQADISKHEKVVLTALRRHMKTIGWTVMCQAMPDEPHDRRADIYNSTKRYQRTLKLCEDGTGILACTDGSTTIWLNRKHMMACARKGLIGYVQLVNLLVHEYIHSEGSTFAHAHPAEFYETFHEVVVHTNVSKAALQAYAHSIRFGLEATSTTLSHLESVGVVVDLPVGLGVEASEALPEVDVTRMNAPEADREGAVLALAAAESAVPGAKQRKPVARKPRARTAAA